MSSSGKGTTFLWHVIHAMVFVTCRTATILPVIDAVSLVGSTSANGTWNGSTSQERNFSSFAVLRYLSFLLVLGFGGGTFCCFVVS